MVTLWWIERRWLCGSLSWTTLKKRSRSSTFLVLTRPHSLASDHQTLRYAARRATAQQNQVGFDAERLEVADAALQVAEECRIEACEIVDRAALRSKG
jgi:hypothetical protein